MRRVLAIAFGAALIATAVLPAAAGVGELVVQPIDVSRYPEFALGVTLPAGAARTDPAFSISENGREIEVLSAEVVQAERDPIDIVLLVDTSGSMRGKPAEDAKRAASRFVSAMGPKDRVALISFNWKPEVTSEFTSDTDELKARIATLESSGETAVYDALVLATRLLADASASRTAVVLVSDGGDTVSSNGPDAAVSGIVAAQTPVYCVALESPEFDPAFLKTLGSRSNGRYLGATDSGQLEGIYEEIAREIGGQYVVVASGASPNTKDLEIDVMVTIGETEYTAATVFANPRFEGAAPQAEEIVGSGFPTMSMAVVVAIVFVASTLLVGSTLSLMTRQRASLRRLEQYDQARVPRRAAEGKESPGPSGMQARMIGAVGYVAGRRGLTQVLHEKLERAGMPLRPVEYIYFHLLGVLGAGFLVRLLTDSAALTVLIVLAAAVVPILLLESRIRRRRMDFEDQLPEILTLIAGSLRAGWGILQSIALVIEQLPPPASEEFGRVQTEARLGLPVEDALEKMAERLDSDDFRWTVSAINVQREVGGNLAEVLDIVANTIRDRAQLRRHIRSLTAEGRFSGVILIALPFVEILALMLVNPEYLSGMFTTPLGWVLAAIGMVLLAVGAVWLQRVIKVEV
jgi:tight adherence protein B